MTFSSCLLLFLIFCFIVCPGEIPICFSMERSFRLRDHYFSCLWTLNSSFSLFRNVSKSDKERNKTTLWNKRRPPLHMSFNSLQLNFLEHLFQRPYVWMIRPKWLFTIKIKSNLNRLNLVFLKVILISVFSKWFMCLAHSKCPMNREYLKKREKGYQGICDLKSKLLRVYFQKCLWNAY